MHDDFLVFYLNYLDKTILMLSLVHVIRMPELIH